MVSTKPSMQNLNVFQKPLGLFSQSPMTGFYRDGYCRVGPEDKGNHAIAAVVTDQFLDFSASRGNDLRPLGLRPGCKWCLCASRWKEALEARKDDADPVVPKVFLHATASSALGAVRMADLEKFAAEPEIGNAGTAPRGLQSEIPVAPEGQTGRDKMAGETH